VFQNAVLTLLSITPAAKSNDRISRIQTHGNLPQEREELDNQMSSEMVISEDLEGFMPYLPGGGQFGESWANKAIERLKMVPGLLVWEGGHDNGSCGGCTWRADGSNEARAFDSLNDLFPELATLCDDDPAVEKPVVEYGSMPNHTTDADITGGSHKIDGYFVCKVPKVCKGAKPETANLACNDEWKLGKTLKDIVQVS
jgi:hypothetical protein